MGLINHQRVQFESNRLPKGFPNRELPALLGATMNFAEVLDFLAESGFGNDWRKWEVTEFVVVSELVRVSTTVGRKVFVLVTKIFAI